MSAFLITGLSACSTGTPANHKSTSAQPSWATPDNYLGRVPAGQQVAVQVHLKLRNEAQVDVEIASIADPASSMYGHFLSDEQFSAMHMPTVDDVMAVRQHLESNGLAVTYVPGNRSFVSAAGTAAQVEQAFSVKLANYKVGALVRRAALAPMALPASIASRVLTVAGLTQTAPMKPHDQRFGLIPRSAIDKKKLQKQPNDDVPADTCSEWFGKVADTVDPVFGVYGALTYDPCGYRPGQVRDLYGLSTAIRNGNDGTGQTVAIVDAYLSPTLVADAQAYAFNNDPDYPLANNQLTTVMGPGLPSTVDTGWYGEQTLDVEAVHAMAPGAKIVAVGAQSPSDEDLVAAINMVIDKKLGTIISNSYGSPEDGNNYVLWNHILKIAALKGVGVYFSSGDDGDESYNVGFPTADFPASSDLVTAVGGTSAGMGATGNLVFETGWETGVSLLTQDTTDGGVGVGPMYWSPDPPGFWYFGAGGGTSYVYDQPAWQVGIVPAALANLPGAPARVVPDVAMLADPFTGFVIGQTDPDSHVYGEYVIGGTSLACPLFAGTMAVAQQNAKKVYGFANTALYAASKKGAFRDITAPAKPEAVALPGGVAIVFNYTGADLSIHTAVGYDNVTGLGVPNGAKFLSALK